MSARIRAVGIFLLFVLSSAFSTLAWSATCAFGTLAGSTCTVTGADFKVEYQLSAVGMYGDAKIIGSNILFFPTGFQAESIDGAATVATNSAVIIDIFMTNPLLAIDELHLVERGRYQLDGAGSTVAHTGLLDVIDTTNFDFLSDNIVTDALLNINDNVLHNWVANGDIDLLNSPGHFVDTISVNVNITNNLSAFTQPGTIPSYAMIEKTFQQQVVILGVNSMPPPLPGVPVPPAVWLFGSGLLGLVGCARRRSAAA